MSADNFNKKPDNSINKDEELTAILQRLSFLLDKSVSLDDAIELAKQQSNDNSFEKHAGTNTEQKISEQEDKMAEQTEDTIIISESDDVKKDEVTFTPDTTEEREELSEETEELNSYAELIKKLHTDTNESVSESEPQESQYDETIKVPVDEPQETVADTEEPIDNPEEDPQIDKSMPVSDFINLLKSKHFTEQTEQAEDSDSLIESTQVNEVCIDTEEKNIDEQTAIEENITITESAPAEVEAPAKEKIFDDENALITEKNPLADEYTESQNEKSEEDSTTSKIFDELLACFDDHNLPDDFCFSNNNSNEEEPEVNEENMEIQTEVDNNSENEEENEETIEEPTPEFVPIEHENPEEDELFSKIFSEEKSERKNRERDKKKWQSQGDEPSTFLSGLYDWLEVIVLSAAFALLLFTFILRLAIVDGNSMNHTLHDKELLIISDLMYTPENNDIIVFTSPNYPEPIVKRIIATAGQTVDIDFDTWTVTVDGKVLNEDYINRVPGIMKSSDISFPLTVPEGYIFVMGDNRNDSLDSRNSRIGFVDERFILGEVKLRIFPFDRFGTVD